MKVKLILFLLFVVSITAQAQDQTKCPNGTHSQTCIATCYSQAIDAYYDGVEGCTTDACRRLAYRLLLAQFELCRILYGDELPIPGETSVYSCPKDVASNKCGIICETWAANLLLRDLIKCDDKRCWDQARKKYTENLQQCRR